MDDEQNEKEAYIAELIAVVIVVFSLIVIMFSIGAGPYVQMIIESWQSTMEIFYPWLT